VAQAVLVTMSAHLLVEVRYTKQAVAVVAVLQVVRAVQALVVQVEATPLVLRLQQIRAVAVAVAALLRLTAAVRAVVELFMSGLRYNNGTFCES
jgi:hypothetical protein